MKKNIFLSTFQQVLNIILPFITAPYLARVLGIEGIGIFSYTNSYIIFVNLFAVLGTATYGTREIARNRDNIGARSKIFWEIEALTVITTTVCLCFWIIWILLNTRYRLYYSISTICLISTIFDISWFFAGIEDFSRIVIPSVVCRLLGTISIFLFVNSSDDLWKYVLIVSASTLLANILMWMSIKRYVNSVCIKSLTLKTHFRETVVYFIPTISTTIYTVLDKTLLGLITQSNMENGAYEQATKIINMAKSVSFTGVNLVLQSRISHLFAKDRQDEIKDRIQLSMNYILFVGCLFCFGIMGIAGRFVPMFFGEGYEKTISLLMVMSPLTVIIGVSNCLGFQYYNPAGLRSKSARYIIAGALINLVLNLILIPGFKSFGAAVATIVAEIMISILYVRNCDRTYYDKYILIKQIYKKVIAGIIMCGIIQYLGILISKEYFAETAQILFGGITYLLVLIVLRDEFTVSYIMPAFKRLLKRG